MSPDAAKGSAPPSATPRALLALLLVLTVTTGLVDAISVLGLSRVFTANMTGNVVFMGFAIAATPGYSATRSLAALGAFLTGALIGGRVGSRFRGIQQRWLLVAFVTEGTLYLLAALWASQYQGVSLPGAVQHGLIAITAGAMGLRNATVRSLAVPDMTTTVLTLTVTGLGADSGLAGGSNPRWIKRASSVAAMLGGAAIGALLVSRFGLAVPLCITGIMTILAALTCRPLRAAISVS